jgi:hypothetical protein
LRYYESVEIKIKYYAKAVTITNGAYTMLCLSSFLNLSIFLTF